MVGLLHTMAFMMLLLVGWVIWNNKPLTIDVITSKVASLATLVTGPDIPNKRWSVTVGHVLQSHMIDGNRSNMSAAEVNMERTRIGYPEGYLQFFWIRFGFGYIFLKKIGSGQDQDNCLISITKFSWQWCKMSQMMVLLFSLLWFYIHKKSKWYCQYVLHASQSMTIRFTSL